MSSPFFGAVQDTRHKNFISYYHQDDEPYRIAFEKAFSSIFINKSVRSGDIDPDNSSEYVKRLISEGYITDASVVTVLIGPNTRKRKHVDWEISAALNKKVGGYSGLIGILLPSVSLLPNGNYRYEDLPPRLETNAKSGYAPIYTWAVATQSASSISGAINDAFQRRTTKSNLIDNSLPLFVNNRT